MKYLYKKFARYYDLIYSKKDYGKEVRFIEYLIKKNKIRGKDILETGCGTGNHALLLNKKGYSITGIDINDEMLQIARKKVKNADFLHGDMKNFQLKKRFDIILCLFSTMHYNFDYRQLEKTLLNFRTHLKEGGLLIFDMGFNEGRFRTKGYRFVDYHENGNVLITRVHDSYRKGNFGMLGMAYIIFEKHKAKFAQETHKIRIFDTIKVRKILENAGFKTRLYNSYTKTSWSKNSKKYVVFSGVKI